MLKYKHYIYQVISKFETHFRSEWFQLFMIINRSIEVIMSTMLVELIEVHLLLIAIVRLFELLVMKVEDFIQTSKRLQKHFRLRELSFLWRHLKLY